MPDEICGAPSFSSKDGVDQWYECQLPAGHFQPIVDDEGNLLVEMGSLHDYIPVDNKPAKVDW